MKFIVWNIEEHRLILNTNSGEEFITFVKEIAVDKGDEILGEYVSEAIDYINTYCNNLILSID